MKTRTLIVLLGFLFLSIKGFTQSAKPNPDSTYAILEVIIKGEYQIKIYYGNNKVEEFKKIDFSRKDQDPVYTEIVNALNYLAKKGYTLQLTNTFEVPYTNIQYILQKKE